MQPPAQDRIALDGKEAEGRIRRPVDLQFLSAMPDAGFAETGGTLPIANGFLHFVARFPQGPHVEVAGSGDLFGRLVENVEIVAEAHRVVRRMQHEATGEMAPLAPIGGEHFQHLALMVGQRHRTSC